MNSKTRGIGGLQGMGWVVGSTSLLLLISAGVLALFAQQAQGQVSLATMLLALFLAFWLYVLGLVGLLFLSVRWLVSWRRVRVKRAAMGRYAPAEPRSRRLEQPALESPHSLQLGVAPVVPSRSSMDIDAPNKAVSSTRVA